MNADVSEDVRVDVSADVSVNVTVAVHTGRLSRCLVLSHISELKSALLASPILPLPSEIPAPYLQLDKRPVNL